jgi:PAS domain S-box-containing protein
VYNSLFRPASNLIQLDSGHVMSRQRHSLLLGYVVAAIATLLATLLRKSLDPILGNMSPYTAYYVAIVLTAWYGGIGPSLAALISGGLLADYLFVDPRGSFRIHDLEHQVGLGLYVLVGLFVAVLCESLRASRRRTEAARAALADANRGLQGEIAERQRAEQWLLESEQRFRGYFEQGLVGMAMLSAEKGWIEVNKRLCQMFSYTERELMLKAWSEIVHPDDLPGDETHFERILSGASRGFVTDQRFLRKDGRILNARVSAQCMRKDDGALDCFLVLVLDLTDRTRQHADIPAARESAPRVKSVVGAANRVTG